MESILGILMFYMKEDDGFGLNWNVMHIKVLSILIFDMDLFHINDYFDLSIFLTNLI